MLGFSYNPAGQISQASRDNVTDAYTYAGHANIHLQGAADGLNRIANTGFAHDANGNLTADPGGWGPGHGAHSYSYDIENRLTGASGGVTIAYDPLGRIARYTAGGTATDFLYDGDALTLEYDASGNVLRRYVHGQGTDVPLVQYEGATLATERYLHADERGSIVAIADAAGNAIGLNRYDEYGVPAATNLGRFQYTGQLWLPEAGLYHYKARAYGPYVGRFLQTDPVGYDDQFNLYAYVGNDPVNRADPDGKQFTSPSDPRYRLMEAVIDFFSQWGEDIANSSGTDRLAALAVQGMADRNSGDAVSERAGARQLADSAARIERAAARSEGRTLGATAGLVTREGQVVTGRSTRAGGIGRPTNDRVQRAVNGAERRRNEPGPYPGCCAEIDAISGALNAGLNVRGATISTIRVSNGQRISPCQTCEDVLKIFGIRPE